jgi:hypothetical protein
MVYNRCMKAPVLSVLALLIAVATSGAVPPENAAAMEAKMKVLDKRIADDVTAGTIPSDDGQNFSDRINHVRHVIAAAESLDAPTRQSLRDDLTRVEKDITDKEAAAKAGTSPVPPAALGATAQAMTRSGAPAAPTLAEEAPALAARIKVLQKKVSDDVKAGILSSDEGAKLNARLSHVQDVGISELPLNGKSRQALRNDVATIDADITKAEGAAKSALPPAPAASPHP